MEPSIRDDLRKDMITYSHIHHLPSKMILKTIPEGTHYDSYLQITGAHRRKEVVLKATLRYTTKVPQLGSKPVKLKMNLA